jgi:hypothetical protein
MADVQPVGKIIDIKRLVLFTDGEGDRRARFQFSVREGYPRLTVFTGPKGREGIITGPIDLDGLFVFTSKLREIADGPKNEKFAMVLKTMLYEDNKPTKQKQVASTLFCGKDEEGVVWVGLQAEGKPKLKFNFVLSDFMELKKMDGNIATKDELSPIVAKSYAKMMEDIMPYYIMKTSMQDHFGGSKPTPATTNGSDLSDLEF